MAHFKRYIDIIKDYYLFMKVVFIYGPPATGKLTVSNELSNLTEFKIFHNHLTVDLLSPIFEYGTDHFFDLSNKIRLELFEEAAKHGVKGVIFTFCYGYPEDNKWVKKVINCIEKQKSKIYFVHLYADKKELRQRIKSPSRVIFGKIKSTKRLNENFKKWDFFTPIPFVKSLSIDNTNISPNKVAREIKKHFNL